MNCSNVYLGRLVSGEGVKMDPQDLKSVLVFKEREPQTIGDVKSLLGFLGYYRSFIQDFSCLAKSLFELLQKPNAEGRTTQNETVKIKANAVRETKNSYHQKHLSHGLTNIRGW